MRPDANWDPHDASLDRRLPAPVSVVSRGQGINFLDVLRHHGPPQEYHEPQERRPEARVEKIKQWLENGGRDNLR
jgi:hypothetical protein